MIGNLLSKAHMKPNFHKTHHFDWKNEVLISSTDRKAQQRLPSLKYESKNGAKAFKLGIPDWITFDNQILRFSAVSFDRRGSSPVVKAYFYHILYFLEDDSIQVIDKSRSDDLKLHGAHLKRHRIPKTDLYINNDVDYFRIDDFNINKEVVIYNKTYRIYDCDQFTRDYLTKLGVIVPDQDEKLLNLQTAQLDCRDVNRGRPATCPNYRATKKPLRQFLEYDGKVLTFFCLRLTHQPPFEKLLLLYYLSNDTIEIRENVVEMTLGYPLIGQPPPPRSKILVQRSKIPKVKKLNPLPGDTTGAEYYTDQDLAIGSKFDIWGRVIFIYDCDEFTKRFLNLKYGIDVKAIPLEELGIIDQDKTSHVKRSQSAFPFRAKKLPYQPEFVKFIKYGSSANNCHILRFQAVLSDRINSLFDKNRNFIISYHLADDTVTVYEKPERNTGTKIYKVNLTTLQS